MRLLHAGVAQPPSAVLDNKYVYRLRMMSGALSAAMETGCWCEQ